MKKTRKRKRKREKGGEGGGEEGREGREKETEEKKEEGEKKDKEKEREEDEEGDEMEMGIEKDTKQSLGGPDVNDRRPFDPVAGYSLKMFLRFKRIMRLGF